MNGRETQDVLDQAAPAAIRSLLPSSRLRGLSLGLVAVLGAGATPGCDHFRVESFHGSKVLMQIANAPASAVETPAAMGAPKIFHHVELWARDAANETPAGQNLVRMLYSDGEKEADGSDCDVANNHRCLPQAFVLVPAVGPFKSVMGADGKAHSQPLDGCMIDAVGNLQWHPEALDPATKAAQGALGAITIQRRIDQLTTPIALIALVPWDDAAADPTNIRPPVDDDLPVAQRLSPAARLAACKQLWSESAASYSANIRQITAPVHGALLGVVDYLSLAPPQLLGGIAFPTNWSLLNLRELWLTDTVATVAKLDPRQYDCGAHPDTCRGTVFLDGPATTPGRGAIHFELRSPQPQSSPFGGVSGSATIQTGLDQDPQQF